MKLVTGTKAYLDINTNMLWAAWYSSWKYETVPFGVYLSYKDEYTLKYSDVEQRIEVGKYNLFNALEECGVKVQLCDEHPTFLSEKIRSSRIRSRTFEEPFNIKEFLIKNIGDRADRY
jgi:methylaspartate ammonia-lyase